MSNIIEIKRGSQCAASELERTHPHDISVCDNCEEVATHEKCCLLSQDNIQKEIPHKLQGGQAPLDKLKPSWKSSPWWARWLVMDHDGLWWWYEKKPKADIMFGHWKNRQMWAQGKYEPASLPRTLPNYDTGWMHTRESRPYDYLNGTPL